MHINRSFSALTVLVFSKSKLLTNFLADNSLATLNRGNRP